MRDLHKIVLSEENSKIRAEIWGDFVGWDNRRRGENGFLERVLKEHNARKVLDVASGDGVDAIFLATKGFSILANEVDEPFRKKTIENARKHAIDLMPTSLDWRNLNRAYSGNSLDALICMGNSLTCLFGRENQIAALKQFRTILKPGGILVLDERNYQRILENREAALNGTLHSSGKYLYTGTGKVSATFLEINDDAIYIEYTHKGSGKKAYYKVYPFKKDELLGLLKEVGFSDIARFSDYSPGVNDGADFFQYVCIK